MARRGFRYALLASAREVQALFGYRDEVDFPPRYNIAPTQPVAVVVLDQGERRFVLMRWGFIPGFVKDPKDYPLVINVRSETVREKPSFRAAFRRRRCLIPTDGFYEWQAAGKTKRPFLIRRPDRSVFALAAIWETWSGPDGSEIWELWLSAAKTSYIVAQCIATTEPAYIAKHAFQMAQLFNTFYHRHPILAEADEGRKRFLLTTAAVVRRELIRVLNMMGSKVPNAM